MRSIQSSQSPILLPGWLIAFSLLVLAGCGGGGGGSNGTPIVAPAIMTHPQNTSAVAGQDATFSVTASGTTLSYQWKRGGSAISGATGASYKLTPATPQDNNASFTVDVSNSAGSVTSAAATLTVNVPPAIAAQPQSATSASGQPVTFSVTATGTSPLVYQWKKNGTAITGATSASLTLSPATAQNNGALFTVDVINIAGTATSTAANLQIDPPIELLAGSLGGPGNLDGSTTNARIGSAGRLTVDTNGNIAFIDSEYNKIRTLELSASAITTRAGKGTPGGADGSAATAQFNFNFAPGGITFDGSGNMYVADSANSTIRKITPAGIVSTLSGIANTVGLSDGAGALALFNHPSDITFAVDGNLYVADRGNNAIRRVTLAGVVTTVAGGVSAGTADGAGSVAKFNFPSGIASPCYSGGLCIMGSNNSFFLYIADTQNNTIRQIAVAGTGAGQTFTVSTLAGTPGAMGSADGTGTNARFNNPEGIALGGGNIYVADTSNSTIRKITGNVVTTIAGLAGQAGSANGSGTAARFGYPTALTYGPNGLVVSDFDRLRQVTSAGVVTTLAGVQGNFGLVDGSGSSARFGSPRHVATDLAGNMYVADQFNEAVRKISPAGLVTTLAGAGTASTGAIKSPFGITVDASGIVWVSDVIKGILKVAPNGAVTAFAGTDSFGAPASVGADALAADTAGNVYVTDLLACAIRKITPAGVISTLAGGTCGYADGTGSAAKFQDPRGVAVDCSGTVFVADSGNYAIRKIIGGGIVTTLAGSPGIAGSADGSGGAARFSYLWGIAVDCSGNIYAADGFNHAIRLITPTGNVSTVVGTTQSVGIQPGVLPGSLNSPFGIAVLPGSNVSLVVTDGSEDAVLTVSFP